MITEEELRKLKNREKQRKWRENNLLRSREIKLKNMRKARGIEPGDGKPLPKPEVRTCKTGSLARSVLGYGLVSTNEYFPSHTALCTDCGRTHLAALGCVFCLRKPQKV